MSYKYQTWSHLFSFHFNYKPKVEVFSPFAMCLIRNTVLLLTAVSSVTAQYQIYEEGQDEQDVGYDSPGPLTGANFVGGKGIFSYGGTFNPAVKYVTPQVTSYGEPVQTAYYDAGDHSSVTYGGAFGEGHGDPSGRVRVQVYRGPTLTSGLTHYAPWGYYVIQPSNEDTGNSYGY